MRTIAYYAASLDGEGGSYPWGGVVWKSADGTNWTEIIRLPGHIYQPIGLLLDSKNELHLQVACYTGAECFPGVAPAPGADMGAVYPVRLEFKTKLSDGSIDTSVFSDHTIRNAGSERYYQGLAIDPTGRYLYSAYAVGNWDLYLNVFDTRTGQDVHTSKVGSPPAGRAWLYPRVEVGKKGQVALSFSQYILGTPNSAYLDGALLTQSVDSGRTFSTWRTLASEPDPDGDGNWVDASDIKIDQKGTIHAVFYARKDGVSTGYYQKGIDGAPVEIGEMDNHSQLVVRPNGDILAFSSDADEVVVASKDRHSSDWEVERFTVPGVTGAYWPNLVSSRSGSAMGSFGNHKVGMLLASQTASGPAFNMMFATYER